MFVKIENNQSSIANKNRMKFENALFFVNVIERVADRKIILGTIQIFMEPSVKRWRNFLYLTSSISFPYCTLLHQMI